ncbi:hypothetical protein J4441_05050 [Candidatus Micrarchaeota archaeon]|nr:hypothetical protein [Candidatus Micrarchaeota archaeon]
MYSTMKFEGLIDRILAEAVRQGLAKTKAEAIRLGVVELNNKYELMQNRREDEEDLEYIRKARAQIASGKLKLHTEAQLKKALWGE